MNNHERNIKSGLEKFTNLGHRKEFEEYLQIRNIIDKVNISTQEQDMYSLRKLSEFLKDIPFEKATQKDMMGFDTWLRKHMGHDSSSLVEARVKRFYKYLFNKDEYKKGKQIQKILKYPDVVIWMSATTNSNELPLENILTEKQIKKMLNTCKDVREQTILISLVDGGLRASELCSLKIKNVGFDKQLGAYFILPKKTQGLKTGQRKIQLFLIPSSTSYIREYLNHHKIKNDPDAPFIYSDSNVMKNKKTKDMFLTPEGLWGIVKRITRNSGIKDIHPHTLRHVSATYCAMKGFNEAMMRERFGWSRSSKMPSYYTHLAGKDTTDYIKKILGIKDIEEPEESLLQPVICWNCETENPPTHKFCGKCSANLKPKKEELTPTATETGLDVQNMIKDKDFMMKMMNMMAEQWETYQQEKKKE